MMPNTNKMRTNAELSPFQKRIESIDNPILCVSEVEQMIDEIGQELASDIKVAFRPRSRFLKSRNLNPFCQGIRFR